MSPDPPTWAILLCTVAPQSKQTSHNYSILMCAIDMFNGHFHTKASQRHDKHFCFFSSSHPLKLVWWLMAELVTTQKKQSQVYLAIYI